jgi:hypothetical protein
MVATSRLLYAGTAGTRRHREFLNPRTAEVFEQQNHLQFLVSCVLPRAVCACVLKSRDSFGELRAIARATRLRFQNTGTQKLGDKLKFVGRQAGQKAAGFRFQGPISTRNKGGYQGISHGRSPVGEEAY